jgi:MFS family permease
MAFTPDTDKPQALSGPPAGLSRYRIGQAPVRRRDHLGPITRQQVRSSLRLVTVGWMCGVAWQFITTGTPMAVFGQQIGFSGFHFGFLTMLPLFGMCAQPIASYHLERHRQRKPMFLRWMSLNRWPWLFVVIMPLVLPAAWTPTVVLLAIAAMSLCAGAGFPAWISWMTDLVPRRRRGKYFAVRSQWSMVALVATTVLAGGALQWGDELSGRGPLYVSVAILLVATVLGLVDIQLFRWVAEPQMLPAASVPSWRQIVSVPLADAGFRKLLHHTGALMFSIGMLGPFFMGPFMQLHAMNVLGFSKLATTVLIGMMPPIGFVLASRVWGHAIDRWGSRPAMSLSLTLSVLSAIGWLVVAPGGFITLLAVGLFAGVAWSGIQTADMNLILKYTGSGQRNGSCHMGVIAAVQASAGVAGGLTGGLIAETLQGVAWHIGPLALNNYMTLVLISIAVRMLSVLLLVPRLDDDGAKSARHMLREWYKQIPLPIFQPRTVPVPAKHRNVDAP